MEGTFLLGGGHWWRWLQAGGGLPSDSINYSSDLVSQASRWVTSRREKNMAVYAIVRWARRLWAPNPSLCVGVGKPCVCVSEGERQQWQTCGLTATPALMTCAFQTYRGGRASISGRACGVWPRPLLSLERVPLLLPEHYLDSFSGCIPLCDDSVLTGPPCRWPSPAMPVLPTIVLLLPQSSDRQAGRPCDDGLWWTLCSLVSVKPSPLFIWYGPQ